MRFEHGHKRAHLDVSVDVAELVRLLNGEHHLGNVEFGKILLEDVLLDEQVEQISSAHVLHDEVEVVGILKAVDQSHDPAGMVARASSRHDVSLGAYVSFLALAQHVGFSKLLHGVQLARPGLLDERDDSKSPVADRLELDEGIGRDAVPQIA